jgi:hypothetical protein
MASARSTKGAAGRQLLNAFILIGGVAGVVAASYFALPLFTSVTYSTEASSTVAAVLPAPKPKPVLNAKDYRTRLLALAHVATTSPWYAAFLDGTTTASTTIKKPLWPYKTVLPNAEAILPFKRVVAYYGNFYSKQMGVLGEYDKPTVLQMLKSTAADWEAADPHTPVLPAIEYIDVTAQGSPGKDGKYRLRMPDTQIDKALEYAHEVNGIVILDIQPGLSTVEEEVPLIANYLKMPEVHLALDPEFAMHNGQPPGRVIGSLDADDINWAIQYLSVLVKENNLPPKILVVHRFTEDMVTNYKKITPTPEVQVVMQMDGWGSPQRKKNTYYTVVNPEPVQFTGLKLFYKNDLKEDPPRLLTKQEVLQLTPAPIFIQYQ